MADSQAWKEKYFKALEDLEVLENKAKIQANMLRRVVVNLGAVASGLDEHLDRAIIAFRDCLTGGSGSAVLQQLESLERVVRDCELKRDGEKSDWLASFDEFCDQLQHLRLSSELEEQLKSFRNSLKKKYAGESQRYYHYRDLLHQLNQLQSQAFNVAAQEDKGLWQRLKGGVRLDPREDQDSESETLANENAQPLEPNFEDQRRVDNEPSSQTVILEPRDTSLDGFVRVLKEIVEAITPSSDIEQPLNALVRDLEQPLTWVEVSPLMARLRDILMTCFVSADTEFSEYLSRVNSELHEIGQRLNELMNDGSPDQQAAASFERQVSDQMSAMRLSLENSIDLDALKMDVKSQIDQIQSALDNYQREVSEGDSLSKQLKTLVEKVHSVEEESKKTKDLLAEERYKATHDPLTKLPNRVAYSERVAHEWRRRQRYKRPLSIGVCDIDLFKSFNDRFGHQIGDKVLCVVAKYLKDRVREVDFVARYGGEEFVILFPETSVQNAEYVANQVREAIAAKDFQAKEQSVKITLSFGVTEFTDSDTVVTAFERADQALYQAKAEGRNCCRSA